MAVHGGSGIAFGCIEALRALKPSLRKADLVHRLDRGTSGCLVVAKRRSALRQLHAVLREGGMEKRYLALVRGRWQHGQADIEQPLSMEATRRRALRPRASGGQTRPHPIRRHRAARIGRHADGSRDRNRTHTPDSRPRGPCGPPDRRRTRVTGGGAFNAELSALGLRRLFLHAHAVQFVWPRSEAICAVSAPLPEALSTVLDTLRRQLRGRGGRNRPHGARPTAR